MARVDVWLWSIRLYKTRALAKTACDRMYITVNGSVAKPSRTLRVGDIVCIRDPARLAFETGERVFRVEQLLEKRVGAPLAQDAYTDLAPVERKMSMQPRMSIHRGEGRPRKKERRVLDRMLDDIRSNLGEK